MSSDLRRITASNIAVKLSSQKFCVQMNRHTTVETQNIFKECYLRDYIIINCKHKIGLLASHGATCRLLRIAWNQMSPKSEWDLRDSIIIKIKCAIFKCVSHIVEMRLLLFVMIAFETMGV